MILLGDVLDMLRTLPDESVNCVVTSPPYWGLRDYGVEGQIGLEKTPAEYVARMVEVFEEVRRVLRKDGTCWVNLGDSYAATQSNNGGYSAKSTLAGFTNPNTKGRQANDIANPRRIDHGVKPKDLVGIPWRVAFALQDAGWYLRSEIIWAKPNPMPESVRDRPTKAHEQIFLLTKSPKYWYDADAIAEPVTASTIARVSQANWDEQEGSARVPGKTNGNMNAVVKLPRFGGSKYGDSDDAKHATKSGNEYSGAETRNSRTVWEIATQPYKEAHFATFPPEIPKRCILAGCPVGGVVLDPFLGSGTTAAVAIELGRKWLGIELNPEYAELARKRIADAQPSLLGVA